MSWYPPPTDAEIADMVTEDLQAIPGEWCPFCPTEVQDKHDNWCPRYNHVDAACEGCGTTADPLSPMFIQARYATGLGAPRVELVCAECRAMYERFSRLRDQ